MRLTATLLVSTFLTACSPQLPVEPGAPPVTAIAPAATDQLFEDVRILSADDMQGRLAGTPGNAKARAYVLERFAGIGLKPVLGSSFEQPVTFQRSGQTISGANVIGMIEGSSGSDRALVVMAHYDHVGVKDGQVYNGADDNASGVATLLRIAQSMKDRPPVHDVVFAAVDAEEGGISGSRAMVAEAGFKALLPRIVMAVNFDMVSRSDRNELYAAGAWHFPWLKPRLDAIAAKASVTLKQGHDDPALKSGDWTAQSDHLAFHLAKVPWVYFGVEDHPDYHQPGDDFDKIPQDFFRRSAETTEMAVRAFDADLETIATEAGR